MILKVKYHNFVRYEARLEGRLLEYTNGELCKKDCESEHTTDLTIYTVYKWMESTCFSKHHVCKRDEFEISEYQGCLKTKILHIIK